MINHKPAKLTYHCCCCNRVRGVDGKYYVVPYNHIPGTKASHGYCGPCQNEIMSRRRVSADGVRGAKMVPENFSQKGV